MSEERRKGLHFSGMQKCAEHRCCAAESKTICGDKRSIAKKIYDENRRDHD